ncbi:MAG: tetratricopeptide repeat protein, partial [Verrucomicrobiota bacterium]|nr:tetratricopeptide repeat protein [Verrucomicrobiota bacterium]
TLENALKKAEKDGTQSAEAMKGLRDAIDSLRTELRQVQIDRDAEAEYRRQLADRITAATKKISAITQDNANLKNSSGALPGKLAEMQKEMDKAFKEKGDLTATLGKVQAQLKNVTVERDEALAQVGRMKEAQKQIDRLLADNTALMAKLGDAEKMISEFKMNGGDKDKQIAALKSEMSSVTQQLADTRKQGATYQAQMADVLAKLDAKNKELAQMKTDATASAGDRKRLGEENETLRGIVVRQMKQQAVREKTKQLVLTELQKLEVNSKALMTQIDLLGQPLVRLTEKERKLFKQPTIEISEAEISIAAPKDTPVIATTERGTARPPEEALDKTDPAPVLNGEAVAPEQGAVEPAALETNAPEQRMELASTKREINLSTDLIPKSPAGVDAPLPADPAPEKAPEQAIKPDPAAATASEGAAPTVETSISPNVPADLLPQAHEAKDQFDRGNYRDAERLYEKMLTKAPNNLYVLSNLGVVRFRSGKLKLAEESFKKAIAIAPDDGFSHCTLGIVYYSLGKYDEAVNALTKALAITPKNATAHNYLGITASQKGWQEAAQKELETATAIDPNYADAHFNLAVVFATQQPPNKENARKHYKRATELGAQPDTALEQLIK